MRVVLAFIGAVLTSYVLGVVSYGQLNLANLVEMGLPVDAGLRWQVAVHDLAGMAGIYLPVVAVALLLGFSVAKLILRWLPQLRTLGYVAAGFVGLLAVMEGLSILGSGTHPLAVTRTTVGLLSQAVSGGIAGYVFVYLLPVRASSEQT